MLGPPGAGPGAASPPSSGTARGRSRSTPRWAPASTRRPQTVDRPSSRRRSPTPVCRAELADAMDDSSYDEAVQKSHHRGMDQVGDEVGTPDDRHRGHGVLRSGADLDPARRGGRRDLGRPRSGWRAYPYFFELKRSREAPLDFS